MLKNFNKKSFLALYLIFSLFIVSIPNYSQATQQQIYLIKDSEIEDFISILIAPILKVAGIDPTSLNIYIVNDSTPNAFVSGGQNIFVHTGLITIASNYNEIAGVLAHELGHITAGHLSRGSNTYQNASWLILLGMAGLLGAMAASAGSGGNGGADVIGFLSYGAMQATQSAVLSYSRSEESQADQIALEYIKETDYNPKGFYDFMSKLHKKEDSSMQRLPSFVIQTTHPLTSSRMDFIEDYLKKNTYHYVENKDLANRLTSIQAKIRAFNKESNAYPKNSMPFIYFEAVKSYAKEDFPEAIKLIQQLINKDADNIYYKELLADSYFGNKDYTQAVSYYNQIVRKFQSNKDLIYYKIALANFAENKNKEALTNISLSIQINNKNPATWHLKSLILGKMNDFGGANLALAEQSLIMENKQRALFFAQKALTILEKNTNEYFLALDIINAANRK
ncbi:MAG: M48 family metalloprotease [Alphaproteobacteria bacterium]|jgi:predicted Zn-dependent protease|nr:M48 family metalloprotease [Alphaproteobacteria bacterium]